MSPDRARILDLLTERPRTSRELRDLTGLSWPHLHGDLSALRRDGLVEMDRPPGGAVRRELAVYRRVLGGAP